MKNRSLLTRVYLVAAIVCASCLSSTQAGKIRTTDPGKVGLRAAKLNEIDALMHDHLEEGRMVGAIALVAKDNQVVYFDKWGDQDRAKGVPMAEDTIFRIYSMSKPITSVAIMQLVEQGKIDLDISVAKHLPEFKELKVLETVQGDDGSEGTRLVPAEREITVRDLLRHTSGLTYGFFGDSEVDKQYLRAGVLMTDGDIAETVTKLSKLPLKHQPGTRFEYSVSTDVLGRIVEVVSGETLDVYFAKHIFEPLGMTDTSFSVPQHKQDRFAEMYSRNGDDLEPAPARRSRRFVSATRFFSGGGGLCSTTHDYLRFCMMLLNEGTLDGQQVLRPETVREMTRNQLDPKISPNFQFGLGFALRNTGDYGWGGAAGTRFWIHPEKKIIGLVMVQINPYRGPNFEQQLKRIVYSAVED